MVDNVSYIQGPVPALAIIHSPHVSTASLSKGWGGGGGLEGHICLPALQPVSCLSLVWMEKSKGALYISILGL